MKQLYHCVELRTQGPVEIANVARRHVDECVQHGLSHDQTRHALNFLAGLGADALGAAGAGVGTAIKEYLESAGEHFVECLQDTDQIESSLGLFDAQVKKVSTWEYWCL